MKNPRAVELESHIGEYCTLNGKGDLAMCGDLKKFIYDKTPLTIEKVTKGGNVVVRHKKHTYSVPPKNIDLDESEYSRIGKRLVEKWKSLLEGVETRRNIKECILLESEMYKPGVLEDDG